MMDHFNCYRFTKDADLTRPTPKPRVQLGVNETANLSNRNVKITLPDAPVWDAKEDE